jgi:tRNA pseudouridine38-40 synthase
MYRTTKHFNARNSTSHRSYDYYLPTFVLNPNLQVNYDLSSPVEEDENRVIDKINILGGLDEVYSYRIQKADLERLQLLVGMFEGTHKFHNYTRKVHANDANAYRYIMEARAIELSYFNNIEFIRISFQGQSFLYNQIRKMIGILFLCFKYNLPDSSIADSLVFHEFHMPIAPAQGLMLNRLYFDAYNLRKGIHEKLIPWDSKKQDIDDFRMSLVQRICASETESQSFTKWLAVMDEVQIQFDKENSA